MIRQAKGALFAWLIGSLCVAAGILMNVSVIAPLRDKIENARRDEEAAMRSARKNARSLAQNLKANTLEDRIHGRISAETRPSTVLLTVIAAEARQLGLETKEATYRYSKRDDVTIKELSVSMPVAGRYLQVRRFVDRLLATHPNVGFELVRIKRQQGRPGFVECELQLTMFESK